MSFIGENWKKFHNCRFFLSPGPVSEYGMTFFHRACPRENGGQAVIPAQSLSLAKAGAGIHKKGIYFAVDSRPRGACPREGGEIASPASARACPRDDGGQALAKARDGVVKLFNRQL